MSEEHTLFGTTCGANFLTQSLTPSNTLHTQPSLIKEESILSSINLNSMTFCKNQDITSSTTILFDSIFRSKETEVGELFRSRSGNKENVRDNFKVKKTLVKKENLNIKHGKFQKRFTREKESCRNPTVAKIIIDLRSERNQRGMSSSLSKSQSSIFSSTKLMSLNSFNSFNSLNNSGINEFKPSSSSNKIRVFSRIKPDYSSFFNLPGCEVLENKIKMEGCLFHFDHIFNQNCSQEQIFQEVGIKAVNEVIQGYNSTIFVYGQTGSGKTFTMFGGSDSESQGIIPRSITEIFKKIKSDPNTKYCLKASMLEIYKQNLADLFSFQNSTADIKMKDGKEGLVIQNLNQIEMYNEKDLNNLIQRGHQGRKVASTKLNEHSSRSHTIIILNIQSFSAEGKIRKGKLYLVDLAGSEKVSKSGAEGETLQEAKKINLSLSCLGNVINALISRSKRQHIPYRDSKLTRVLQQSLGGNCITSIIVNMSQKIDCYDQSLSTLKFAQRVSRIKKTVSLNSSSNDIKSVSKLHQIIINLQNELKCTKEQLSKYKSTSFQNVDNLTARHAIPSQRANVQEKLENYNSLRHKKIPKMKLQININDLSIMNTTNDDRLNSSLISPSLSSLSFNKSSALSRDNSLNFSIKPEEDKILGDLALDQSFKSLSVRSRTSKNQGGHYNNQKSML